MNLLIVWSWRVSEGQVGSPLLSQEGDVELVPLQLLAGVGHHLVEGALQQVVPPHNQPGTHPGALNNVTHTHTQTHAYTHIHAGAHIDIITPTHGRTHARTHDRAYLIFPGPWP